jgi:Spy/CpxP family protein refolding chaperone
MRGVMRIGLSVMFVVGILMTAHTALAASNKNDSANMAVAVENELGLTPEQQTKLQNLRTEFSAKQVKLQDDLRIAKASLQKELDSANPDRKKSDTLVASVNKLQAQVLSVRVDHVFAMRAILTPEQYQKLVQLREQKRQERKAKASAPVEKAKPAGKGKK